MTADELIELIANLTPLNDAADIDDHIQIGVDAIDTVNRLIKEAREIRSRSR